MAGIRKQFDLRSISLDTSSWQRVLEAEMEEEIKGLAVVWLKNAILTVPVWSRASHGTFKPLADAVGFIIPSQPLIAKKDRSALGQSVSRGGLELTGSTFHFSYETNLQYLIANETMHVEYPDHGIFSPQGLRTETPFNFTKTGEELFKREMLKVRLPDPFRFLRTRKF